MTKFTCIHAGTILDKGMFMLFQESDKPSNFLYELYEFIFIKIAL
jgi:hypothetical protein